MFWNLGGNAIQDFAYARRALTLLVTAILNSSVLGPVAPASVPMSSYRAVYEDQLRTEIACAEQLELENEWSGIMSLLRWSTDIPRSMFLALLLLFTLNTDHI